MMELESADDKRIQAFNNMLIQKNKVAQTYNKSIKRKNSLFGRLFCQLVPKTKNWVNGLPIGRDFQSESSTTRKRILASKPTRRAT